MADIGPKRIAEFIKPFRVERGVAAFEHENGGSAAARG